ncbi:methionine ABC transporter ATP-binding protein [Gemella sp. oral taxon 928]|uniref:methionine ABC transporter ATP-binding protein n=1 Tax=Gemella sp. oral taxon 928 TaxID=1785995 RepID=UPI0007680923|nr:methionine ABC transporter ATP-binding protein [Gemella sp. oral taxon 928]AME09978.1 methionine ABC transporter ATP-binding protein [Gemella sp. oral taxon 928]
MIELKNVNKIYNNKVHALKDINLKVEKGDIYGIIGYSGAGKSTLVRLLNGLEVATSGEVIIDGEDFNKINEEQRRLKRQKIGMIFQHFNLLWSRTVAENIAFPLEILGKSKSEIKPRVRELAKLVGLEDRLNSYPSQLSGGQKQRVGIARALAGNPTILLCDEATSALDPETTAEVLDLIKKIHAETNITVVLITHEMNVIKTICTKVAVIDNGGIAENGLVTDVFYHPKQEVSKKFLSQTSFASQTEEQENIKEWKETFTDGVIIKFTFSNSTSKKPILSTLVKEIDFDFTIINGHLDKTADANIGTLFVQLIGTDENIQKAITKLNELGILTEVL